MSAEFLVELELRFCSDDDLDFTDDEAVRIIRSALEEPVKQDLCSPYLAISVKRYTSNREERV